MGKVFIEETTLTAIGDAIREQTGKSDLISPTNMPTEIRSSSSSKILLSGSLYMAFANDNVFTRTQDSFETENITSTKQAFQSYSGDSITLDINCDTSTTTDLSNTFSSCNYLKNIPNIIGAKPSTIYGMFGNCNRLRTIPSDYFDTWDTSGSYSANMMFQHCYSLRKPINVNVLKGISNYSNMFYECYALDEITKLPVYSGTATSNIFSTTFRRCSRLKYMRFETETDGTPKTANWSNQTIDLSYYVGYAVAAGNITGFNSGITTDKEATAINKYDELRSNADWFSCREDLSRYNIHSAVDTIKSLPDTSAYLAANGGTNTIKFLGAAGSNTMWGIDASTFEIIRGKSISDMNEEDIAIATAKGWTVSFV